jgi:hypothetical protein
MCVLMTNWVDNNKKKEEGRHLKFLKVREREKDDGVVRWLYGEPQINSLVFLLLGSYGEISLSNMSAHSKKERDVCAREREEF